MSIIYKKEKDFKSEELKDLFLSVEWSSGHYPEKLAIAMKNSGSVFSAWEGDRLIGLANVLDDGVMTAYIHYMLVRPEYQGRGVGRELLQMVKERYKEYLRIVLVSYKEEMGFYESCGFTQSGNAVPMFITSLWT